MMNLKSLLPATTDKCLKTITISVVTSPLHCHGHCLQQFTSGQPSSVIHSQFTGSHHLFIVQCFQSLQWCDFWLYRGTKGMCFQFSWASDSWHSTLSWYWTAAAAPAPGQPWDHEGKQPTNSPPLCTQTTMLFFTFITVLNTFYEIFNISSWNRLVFDDFSPL